MLDLTQRRDGAEVHWPVSGGDMGRLIRDHNWTSTPLGALERWPGSLRGAIELMLGCGFPATLQWGAGLVLFYNDAQVGLIGQRHPGALGKPILETFPEIASTYQPLVDHVWRGETITLRDQLFCYTRKNAPEDAWFDLSYSPVFDENHRVAGVFTVALETTAKVLAERARTASEKMLHAHQDRDRFLLRLSDTLRAEADGAQIQRTAARLTGEFLGADRCYYADVNEDQDSIMIRPDYFRGELESIAGRYSIQTFPEALQALKRLPAHVVSDTSDPSLLSPRTRANCAALRIGSYASVGLNRNGKLNWTLTVVYNRPRRWREEEVELLQEVGARTWGDVERASTQQALHQSERYFRALVNATSDVIYRMSPDWSEMRQLRGSGFLSDTDSPEQDWLTRYIHPDDQSHVLEVIQRAIDTRSTFQLEHRVIRADGTLGYTFSRAVPLIDEKGRIIEWFGAASDVTMRKRAEGALRESEKLAAVGRLASSIAHEINNPLEAVTNLIYLAQITMNNPQASSYLDQAQSELMRVSHIASETLSFNKQNSRAVETDIKEVLESVLSLYGRRLRGAYISIDRRYRDHQPQILFANELRQVLANLIGNAIDAMTDRPESRLFLRVRDAHDPRTGEPGVRLTVADTGSGINQTVQRRVFEPFFTTKESVGTGLGLWVSQEIVLKHDGTIRLRSREGPQKSGTVFAIFLPRRDSLPANNLTA
jgi:signal transduction histidine kinase